MHRFFVPPNSFDSAEVKVTGDTAKQMRQVLRMRPGEEIVLLDGLGSEYRARLSSYSPGEALCEILDSGPGSSESAHKTELFLSILNKPDKFEWALQKCTELGVSRFVPVMAERSVTGAPAPSKLERWKRILQEAAEQSGRVLLPSLEEGMTLKRAIAEEAKRVRSVDPHVALMPAMGAYAPLAGALGAVRAGMGSVSIFIGPEGGFTDAELRAAFDAGIRPVSLGPRTLRSETAAVVAVAITLYELGEMGLRS